MEQGIKDTDEYDNLCQRKSGSSKGDRHVNLSCDACNEFTQCSEIAQRKMKSDGTETST